MQREEEMKVTLPSIHMNGTSQRMLLDGYKDISKAFRQMEKAIQGVEFNARDYYVRDGAWEQAKAEFHDATRKIREAKEYFDAVMFGIAGGGHKEVYNDD